MPYTHANGCSVMTPAEFWAHEAQASGKTAAALMEEFYSEVDSSNKNQEKRLSDPEEAFAFMNEIWIADAEVNEFNLCAVLAVRSVSCTGTVNTSCSVTADVLCSDGRARRIVAWESHWAGTFYEPPDCDFGCEQIICWIGDPE